MYCIYITTNRHRTVLYTGISNNLPRRLAEHEQQLKPDCFTSKYRAWHCIYFEQYDDIDTALNREKEIKGWRRAKKIALIEAFNPSWRFLNGEILQG